MDDGGFRSIDFMLFAFDSQSGVPTESIGAKVEEGGRGIWGWKWERKKGVNSSPFFPPPPSSSMSLDGEGPWVIDFFC